MRTVNILVPLPGHEDRPTIGPFDNYDDLCAWRASNNLEDVYRQTLLDVEELLAPEDWRPKHYIEVTLRAEVEGQDAWSVYEDHQLPRPWYGQDPISIPGPWQIVRNERITEG